MKKRLKTNVLAVVFVLLITAVQVFAEEPVVNHSTVSEYQSYKTLISKDDAQLKEMGMSNKEIAELRNFDFNDEFKKRAKLDNETLRKMGYDDSQITTLKSLYPSIEKTTKINSNITEPTYSLEELSLRGIFADCNIYSWDIQTSANTMKIGFKWEWSNAPVFTGTDIFAVAWNGSNTNGQPLNVKIDRMSSGMRVERENLAGSNQLSDQYYYPKVRDYYHAAEYKFSMGEYGALAPEWWAPEGDGQVKLTKIGTQDIDNISIAFSYGHSYIGVNPAVTIYPVSLSFSFSSTVEEMDHESFIYYSN